MSEYVDVKDLPEPIQEALKSVSYGRSNIEVLVSETVVLGMPGASDGYRAFAILVDLTSGRHQTTYGSWGGANMFVKDNPVDSDTNDYALPGHGVAITGVRGGGKPAWAQLHIPTSMRSRVLTAGPVEELPQAEKDALYAHAGLKGGQYRRDYLERKRVPASVVDDLVTRGLLKRNAAGATSITTAGRNALGSYSSY